MSTASREGADWRREVEPYIGSDARRASFQLVTTLGALALAMWASHALRQWTLLGALVLVLPIAGLLVRTFVLMHDCAHGSFFQSRKWNDAVGFVTGVLTLTPFAQWRRDHAIHHATSGNLDRRGHGDVPTLTVREYLARTPRGRLGYRIVRHPLALLLGGPVHLAKQLNSVMMTNAMLLLGLGTAILLAGWQTVVLAYAIPYYFAAMAGVWLFYIQHQFEDAYWETTGEWDYVEASLRGSSNLQLPRILRWVTGDIGLHHVHHVAPKIPNYRLEQCHEENELFHHSPVVTLRSGLSALRLALWDEERQQLVPIRDARHAGAAPST